MSEGNVELEPEVAMAIKAFLEYSFEPIDYQYSGLTPQEKELCDEEDWEKMMAWLRSGK